MGVDELHLLNIAVARSQQNQGMARAMLALLYARCQARQASMLWLEVRPSNERAHALYRREGFVEVGRRPDYYPAPDGREDALVMRRDIPLERALPCGGLNASTPCCAKWAFRPSGR
jgi:ribosomal-protein-alanine N-acetyltransferase